MSLRRIALWLTVLLGGCIAASAQTLTLSASNLVDAAGNAFTGEVDICPVLSTGVPTPFHYAGGKTGLNKCAKLTATAGVFSATVPDTYLTSPQNLCLAIHAWDPVTYADDLGYTCVQPSITSGSAAVTNGWCTLNGSCNLDNYSPSIPALPQTNLNTTGGFNNGSSSTPNTTGTCSGTDSISFPTSGNASVEITLTGACTFTVTDAGAAGTLRKLTLIIHPAGFQATLPASSGSLVWNGGAAPSPSTSAVTIVTFASTGTGIIYGGVDVL